MGVGLGVVSFLAQLGVRIWVGLQKLLLPSYNKGLDSQAMAAQSEWVRTQMQHIDNLYKGE